MKQTPFKGFNEFAVFECLMTEKPVWKAWAQITVKTGYRLDYLPIHLQHTALSLLKSTGRRRQRARLKLMEGMERLVDSHRLFDLSALRTCRSTKGWWNNSSIIENPKREPSWSENEPSK